MVPEHFVLQNNNGTLNNRIGRSLTCHLPTLLLLVYLKPAVNSGMHSGETETYLSFGCGVYLHSCLTPQVKEQPTVVCALLLKTVGLEALTACLTRSPSLELDWLSSFNSGASFCTAYKLEYSRLRA